MRELSLFTGSGGGIWASRMLGWQTVAMVERDEYCQQVLRARQEDGDFDECPIYDDVFTFDGLPWRGRVDVLSAGFPCQPFSVAGRRLAGEDERDGWPHTSRLIREVRPSIAWLENVPGLLTADGGRYFGRILGDLAETGYDALWRVLGAADVGAPHRRDRLWIYAYLPRAHSELLRQQQEPERWRSSEAQLGDDGAQKPMANPHSQRQLQPQGRERNQRRRTGHRGSALSNTYGEGLQGQCEPKRAGSQHPIASLSRGWGVEPDVGRVAHGVASRGDRIKALGNGQCPQSMVAAFLTLRAAAINQGLPSTKGCNHENQ